MDLSLFFWANLFIPILSFLVVKHTVVRSFVHIFGKSFLRFPLLLPFLQEMCLGIADSIFGVSPGELNVTMLPWYFDYMDEGASVKV